jgi:hypothetical protein
LPPVSLIPVANLPPVSLTPVVHLDLRISPRSLEKIRNDPNVIIRGLGEGDSWKKPEPKISWHCPFNSPAHIHCPRANFCKASKSFNLAEALLHLQTYGGG